MRILTIMLVSALTLTGCATVETKDRIADLARWTPDQHIQLMVHTSKYPMDAIVYQLAYGEFSRVMPLREIPPYYATLELTFGSDSKRYLLKVPSKTTSSGSYTGGRSMVTLLRSGTVTPSMNSTMHATLTRNGAEVWSADCNTNGSLEWVGWYGSDVPEEAVLLCAKLLAEQYAAPGGAIPGH